jgi:streptogramin lyase
MRPPAKRIIAVVGILVVSILSILAVVQVGALLRRAPGQAAISGQPTLATGAPGQAAISGQPTLATGAPGTISEVPLPTAGANDLNSITAGPDGNLWFTEQSSSGNVKNIGRITPQGVITEFPVSTTYSGPLSIAAGPDGNLWFTEMGNQIGRITPGGIVTLMTLSASGELSPGGIAAGPDGNLWITEYDRIVRLTPGGSLTEFSLPESHPGEYSAQAITAGPDGSLWFTATELTNPLRFDIGHITLKGAITLISLPSGSPPLVGGIVKGPDGNLWFIEDGTGGHNIGRITPQGVITEFPLLHGGAVGIAAGPDGNLWFTNFDRTIGRITPGGKITEFQVPNADSNPGAITAGPDGNLWFTDGSGSGKTPMIGRVILGK